MKPYLLFSPIGFFFTAIFSFCWVTTQHVSSTCQRQRYATQTFFWRASRERSRLGRHGRGPSSAPEYPKEAINERTAQTMINGDNCASSLQCGAEPRRGAQGTSLLNGRTSMGSRFPQGVCRGAAASQGRLLVASVHSHRTS